MYASRRICEYVNLKGFVLYLYAMGRCETARIDSGCVGEEQSVVLQIALNI